MAQAQEATLTEGEALRFRVEGMDCPSCAGKIETVLGRVPGLSEIKVNYSASTLTLKADAPTLQVPTINAKLSGLGFPSALVGASGASEPAQAPGATAAGGLDHDHDHSDGHAHSRDKMNTNGPTRWWQSKKGRIVLAEVALLAIAYVGSLILPERAEWVFGIAAAIGLVPFAVQAFKLAIAGVPFSIETLMSVAAIGAIAIGESTEAAVVVLLFSIGELLESVAATKARAGIQSLASLMPKTALLLKNGSQTEISAGKLVPGDIILVRPGDHVAADGQITEGSSELNEAAVTGESIPVAKTVGADVFAGTVNASSALTVRVTKMASDNTIARIIHMVEEAQGSKAPMARFIDDFSRIYTPAAMVICALVIVVPPLAFGADWQTWIYRGLSLLLIACPCALVLSTPAAIASGLAVGARRGLLIKGGAALEALGKIKTIAFDKTGTLTAGHPVVTDIISISETQVRVLAIAAAVERGSSHPIGKAILDRAAKDGVAIPASSGGSAIAGKGAVAVVDSDEAVVGSPRYASEIRVLAVSDMSKAAVLEEAGKTVVIVTHKNVAIGMIAVRDEPRVDAKAAIASLKALGIEAVMLTGDNSRTGKAIADSLGLGVRAELMPQAKLDEIGRLKKQAPVAMVGDGINDAPALAAASVGIAMGGGTGVALETADAALLKDRVSGVVEMVRLARLTLANVRQNVTISLGLKAVFLVTSLAGVTPLWMAILADTGATVIVTINALRLLRARV